MNKKKTSRFGLKFFLIPLGIWALWFAWDRGYLGGNPRAMNETTVRKVVEAHVYELQRMWIDQCESIVWPDPPPEETGIAGLAFAVYPNQHSMTYVVSPPDWSTRTARSLQIRRYDELAKLGVLERSETNVSLNGKDYPAVNYRLTWDGFLHGFSDGAKGRLCLRHRERQVDRIESIVETGETLSGNKVYRIQYRLKDDPGSAAVPLKTAIGLRGGQPGYLRLVIEDTQMIYLLRAPHAWVFSHPLHGSEREKLDGADAHRSTNPVVAWINDVGNWLVRHGVVDEDKGVDPLPPPPPRPSLADAQEAVQRLSDSPDKKQNCWPLEIHPGDEPVGGGDGTLRLVYRDNPDRRPYDLRMVAQTLNLLAAMERAGLAQALALNEGLSFTIQDPALVAAFKADSDRHCLRLGTRRLEPLVVQGSATRYRVAGQASFDQPEAWAIKVAPHYFPLHTILEGNVPMEMDLAQSSGDWSVASLTLHYPQPDAKGFPEQYAAAMPRSVRRLAVYAAEGSH
jgi:hypothetical protein